MIRNTHKIGDHLMVDDESGIVHYASEMVQIWDGSWRHKSNWEPRHPQEFVKAKKDPYPIKNVRPDATYPVPQNVLPEFIGNTSIPFPTTGPAAHLFGGGGIGNMRIEDDIEPFIIA